MWQGDFICQVAQVTLVEFNRQRAYGLCLIVECRATRRLGVRVDGGQRGPRKWYATQASAVGETLA